MKIFYFFNTLPSFIVKQWKPLVFFIKKRPKNKLTFTFLYSLGTRGTTKLCCASLRLIARVMSSLQSVHFLTTHSAHVRKNWSLSCHCEPRECIFDYYLVGGSYISSQLLGSTRAGAPDHCPAQFGQSIRVQVHLWCALILFTRVLSWNYSWLSEWFSKQPVDNKFESNFFIRVYVIDSNMLRAYKNIFTMI